MSITRAISTLFLLLQNLVDDKFTGSVEIHFSQGGVAKIEKHEVIK